MLCSGLCNRDFLTLIVVFNVPFKKSKKASVSLFYKIKAKIIELVHWTDKQETKDAVDNLIRNTLWDRQKIYEYVYARYQAAA